MLRPYLRVTFAEVLGHFLVAMRLLITQRAWAEPVTEHAIDTIGDPEAPGSAVNSNLPPETGAASVKPYVESAPSAWQLKEKKPPLATVPPSDTWNCTRVLPVLA